jgi:hypothetical protein
MQQMLAEKDSSKRQKHIDNETYLPSREPWQMQTITGMASIIVSSFILI